MPLWRIYYADGSCVDDSVPRDQVPRCGVVSVAFADGTGLCLAERGDYYVLHRDGRWTAHDRAGLDYLLIRDIDDVALVVTGEQVCDRAWQEIHSRARSDPDFCQDNGDRLAVCADGTKVLLRRHADGSWRGVLL